MCQVSIDSQVKPETAKSIGQLKMHQENLKKINAIVVVNFSRFFLQVQVLGNAIREMVNSISLHWVETILEAGNNGQILTVL